MKYISKILALSIIVVASNLFLPSVVCAQKTNDVSTQTTQKLKTIELKVGGMTCQKGCADGIDKKLKTVDGVSKSSTKLESGISKITYDETKVSINRLIEIISERGYTAEIVKSNKNK